MCSENEGTAKIMLSGSGSATLDVSGELDSVGKRFNLWDDCLLFHNLLTILFISEGIAATHKWARSFSLLYKNREETQYFRKFLSFFVLGFSSSMYWTHDTDVWSISVSLDNRFNIDVYLQPADEEFFLPSASPHLLSLPSWARSLTSQHQGLQVLVHTLLS